MARGPKPRCAPCEKKDCRLGKDCFGTAQQHVALNNDPHVADIHRAASAIEARHYCRATRLEELLLFAKELGCKRLGLAFCVGLVDEAKVIEKILAQDCEVVSVCCKVDGITKQQFDLERISADNVDEVMCNPVGQADLLNQAQTDLNILCGLCVGREFSLGPVPFDRCGADTLDSFVRINSHARLLNNATKIGKVVGRLRILSRLSLHVFKVASEAKGALLSASGVIITAARGDREKPGRREHSCTDR